MIKIRNGVFETNSSSVHAIAVDTRMDPNGWEYCHDLERYTDDSDNEVLEFVPRDFGWEYALLSKPVEKASYLSSLALCIAERNAYEQEKENSKERVLHQYEKIFVEPAKEWLDKFKVRCEFATPELDENGFPEEGYIDHFEDAIPAYQEIMSSARSFMGFLFGSSSVVWTGNDNSDIVPNERALNVPEGVDVFIKGN